MGSNRGGDVQVGSNKEGMYRWAVIGREYTGGQY